MRAPSSIQPSAAAPSRRAGEDVAGRDRRAVEVEMGVDLPVRRDRPLERGARAAGSTSDEHAVAAAPCGPARAPGPPGGPAARPAVPGQPPTRRRRHRLDRRPDAARWRPQPVERGREKDVARRHAGQPTAAMARPGRTGPAAARRGPGSPTAAPAPPAVPGLRAAGRARMSPSPRRRAPRGRPGPRRSAAASAAHSSRSNRSSRRLDQRHAVRVDQAVEDRRRPPPARPAAPR